MEGQRPRLSVDGSPGLWLVPNQRLHFVLILPIFGVLNKPVPYRVVPDIFPICGVTFARTQLPIPEGTLPKRFRSGPFARDTMFPIRNPIAQWRGGRIGRAEEVHMFGQDDVFADPPSAISAPPLFDEIMHAGSARAEWRPLVQIVTKTIVERSPISIVWKRAGTLRPSPGMSLDIALFCRKSIYGQARTLSLHFNRHAKR